MSERGKIARHRSCNAILMRHEDAAGVWLTMALQPHLQQHLRRDSADSAPRFLSKSRPQKSDYNRDVKLKLERKKRQTDHRRVHTG